MALRPERLAFEATPAIHAVIDQIGRTEDLRLSPDNRRLLVLDFLTHRIFMFSIEIELLATPRVHLSEACVIESDALVNPHGLAFLDDDHICVASRGGDVSFFRLPPVGALPAHLRLEPLALINGHGALHAAVKSPGSLDAYPIGGSQYRVLVCNNFWHFVSAHRVRLGDDGEVGVRNEGKLFERDILLPDGISLSPDRQWVAISNHVQGQVLVYRNDLSAGPDSAPVAVLGGSVCPHGLRFLGNDRLIVADAASQYLLAYERGSGWRSTPHPDRYIRIMDDDNFYDGRYDSREGGVKGLHVDASGRVLLTTHRLGVIELYDLERLLEQDDAVDEAEIAALCESRDASIQRKKRRVLRQRWTASARLGLVAIDTLKRLRRIARDAVIAHAVRLLDRRVHSSSEPLLGPGGPVVSLTSHGARIGSVHRTIESIGRGSLKPRRIILWLGDPAAVNDPTHELVRQRARGLEIRYAHDCGPHMKYYPYVMEEPLDGPLVTADDDMLYSRGWLETLAQAKAARPQLIHCHRARRLGIQHGQIMPYNEWLLVRDTVPSHLNFLTGVSGAIYPPAFLEELKRRGDAFRTCAPWADDVWLNAVALQAGIRVAQVAKRALNMPHIPGTQGIRLLDRNVLEGGNQMQLRRTYTPKDLETLSALAFR